MQPDKYTDRKVKVGKMYSKNYINYYHICSSAIRSHRYWYLPSAFEAKYDVGL